ncbi:MAG: HD domain-containing protein [Peptostreptococcaceae bacterium]|nr:HD domain-containing protein [Peptostreptococcaceae bacterium]
MNIDRDQAIAMLNELVTTEHIKTHSLAVEAVMRALAKRLAPDEVDLWGIAGLLHDLDNDVCGWQEDMSKHGPKTVEILRERGFGTEEMYRAILAHNPANGSKITNVFENALYAGDPITGFITAIALVYPDKKLSSVKVKSIVKRMKETRFAAGANREAMWSIEDIGIPFPEFAELSLHAMVEIADQLGL